MARPKKLIAGNWKMNGTMSALHHIAELLPHVPHPEFEVAICPPATLIGAAAELAAEHGLIIGAQDCHAQMNGAFTGEISAAMLADIGAKMVILGHSERRRDCGETNTIVASKILAAWGAGLTAIVCVGEQLFDRESGDAVAIVSDQLNGSIPNGATADNLVVAYEPVWAIGSGLIPTLAQIEQMHAAIRALLVKRYGGQGEGMRILYGGSVSPSNAYDIFALRDVDGGLVGGASLRADTFLAVIHGMVAA